jgi:hypothetical protein
MIGIKASENSWVLTAEPAQFPRTIQVLGPKQTNKIGVRIYYLATKNWISTIPPQEKKEHIVCS